MANNRTDKEIKMQDGDTGSNTRENTKENAIAAVDHVRSTMRGLGYEDCALTVSLSWTDDYQQDWAQDNSPVIDVRAHPGYTNEALIDLFGKIWGAMGDTMLASAIIYIRIMDDSDNRAICVEYVPYGVEYSLL